MPHRQPLLDLLNNYSPLDAFEARFQQQIVNFVKSHEDCFLRSNLSGHITASAWLLSPDHQDVLLTHHKKIGVWLQLGGHADGDNDVLSVALKEAHEESGIADIRALSGNIFDMEVHHIKEHKGVPAHNHYDIRFILLAPNRDFLISEESHNLCWMNIEKLSGDKNFNHSLQRMAKKWAMIRKRTP